MTSKMGSELRASACLTLEMIFLPIKLRVTAASALQSVRYCFPTWNRFTAAVGLWNMLWCWLFPRCEGVYRLPLLNGYHARSSHWKDTPFHWFLGKNHPVLTKTRTFVVRKITPFFWFQGEHIAWWPHLKQIEDIHYSCNTFFCMIFPLPSSSCGHIRTLYILIM